MANRHTVQSRDELAQIVEDWVQGRSRLIRTSGYGVCISNPIESGKEPNRPLIVGMQAPQGFGKSYLAKRMEEYFGEDVFLHFNLENFNLSNEKLDKFKEGYEGNPFYKARGNPGTHDLDHLRQVLEKIRKFGGDFFTFEFSFSHSLWMIW